MGNFLGFGKKANVNKAASAIPLAFRSYNSVIKVLILASDTNHPNGAHLVRSVLDYAAGVFNEQTHLQFTEFTASHNLPTEDFLKQHDVVLIETFSGIFDNATKLGDLLAQFSDAGGGVRVAMFLCIYFVGYLVF